MKKLAIIDALDPESSDVDYDPTCTDSFIHSRLDFFGDKSGKKLIYGFDQKLSFIVTALFYQEVLKIKNNEKELAIIKAIPTLSEQQIYVFNRALEAVRVSDYYLFLNKCLMKEFYRSKGLKIYKAVGKKSKLDAFSLCGSVADFNKYIFDNISDEVGLMCFLLNDSIYVNYIEYKDVKKKYRKYYNKEIRRKFGKHKKDNSKEIELW